MSRSGPGDLHGVDEALHVLLGRLARDSTSPGNLEAGRGDPPPNALLGAQAPDKAVEESAHECVPSPGRVGNTVGGYRRSPIDSVRCGDESPFGPGRDAIVPTPRWRKKSTASSGESTPRSAVVSSG